MAGHTPEQRDQHPLCGAKARTTGEPCRNFAGQGTDHFGFGKCRKHGGATANHMKAAVKEEVRQAMVARSVRVDNVGPHLALLEELAFSAGHVGFLREEIADLETEQLGSPRAQVLLERYDHERDRLTRIAKACSEAGVDEARIRIEEVRATQLVQTITSAAKDAGMPAGYIKALGPALRKQFALLSGDTEVAESAEAQVEAAREKIKASEKRRAEKQAGLIPAGRF